MMDASQSKVSGIKQEHNSMCGLLSTLLLSVLEATLAVHQPWQ